VTKDLAYYRRASQNLVAVHHLKDLLNRLQKNGPEIIVFRGISLLGDVYTMGERSMLDVDILARRRDLPKLKKILRGMGMEEIEPGTFDKKGLLLDVHTSLLNLSRTTLEHSCLRISIDDIFKRSASKKLDGHQIKIPCPAHLFISTAIHLQSHAFGEEKGWEDLKRIKEYYGFSDVEILSEAHRIGAANTLSYLSFLRPEHYPAWKGWLSFAERWILNRIKGGNFNQNFGDLLFLFKSTRKVKALEEIVFPQGISFRVIGNRLRKCLKLLKDMIA
jgi:hypothetical protein